MTDGTNRPEEDEGLDRDEATSHDTETGEEVLGDASVASDSAASDESVVDSMTTSDSEVGSVEEADSEDEAASEETAAEEPAADESPSDSAVEEVAEAPASPRSPKGPIELIEEVEEDEDDLSKDWYILKVQVNRENSICDALKRRVGVAGLERYFGEILVPTEDVREFNKSGKQRIVKRKLYPGYIVVYMTINDDTWFLVRETPGIGDFTGAAGKPTPLSSDEIGKILQTTKRQEQEDEAPEIKTAIKFKAGDRVRVKEGYFQNFEGDVEAIDESNGRITVMINIFGRPTPVELDHWQVEDV